MRPIPAPRIGESHGLLRAISKRDRVRLDEFVTEFQNEELFPPGLENAQGRTRQFVSYARSAGLLKEDRGVVELTEIGKRYVRAGDDDAPFEVSEAQADWLRRQLLEKHMTDSIFHGLAIGLSLLSSVAPGTRISMLDFGRALGYLGRAGWDNDNTLQSQGERYLDADARHAHDRRPARADPDRAGDQERADAARSTCRCSTSPASRTPAARRPCARTGEAEWAALAQAATAPEPEPAARAGAAAAAPPAAAEEDERTSGRTSAPALRRRPPLPRPPRPGPAARRGRPADAARRHLGDRRARRRRRARTRPSAPPRRARRPRPEPPAAEPEPPAPPPVAAAARAGAPAGRPDRHLPPAEAAPPPPGARARAPAAGRGPAAPGPGAQGERLPRRGRDPRRRRGPGPAAAGLAAYASVAAALASGRHVVLTGAAGSGKTTLALAIARAAVTSGRSTGAVLVTPAGRWSSGEALGRRARPTARPPRPARCPTPPPAASGS